MKLRKEYIVLIAVIAALSLYLGLKRKGKVHYTLPVQKELSTDSVASISITRGGVETILVREGGKWVISPENFRADEDIVKEMVRSSASIELSALASESRDYDRYELGEEKRIEVELLGKEGVLRRIEIGKAASSYRHTFVRIGDDPRVYHAVGDLQRIFGKSKEDIRDKKVLTLGEQIQEVSLIKGKNILTVKRETIPSKEKEGERQADIAPTRWVSDDGKDVNGEKIDGIIRTLANLKCDSFISGVEKKDMGKPVFSVSLKGDGTYTVSLFEKSGDLYPAVSSESEYPFYLPEWRSEQIMIDPDDILK